MTLNDLKTNDCAIVKMVHSARLINHGLVPGSKIRVITNSRMYPGPMVEVNSSMTLATDREAANLVEIDPDSIYNLRDDKCGTRRKQ